MGGFTKRGWGAAAGLAVLTQATVTAFSATLTYLDAQQNFTVSASAQTTTTDEEHNTAVFNDLTPFNKTVSITAMEPAASPGGSAVTSTFAATVTSDLFPQTIQVFTGVNESLVYQPGTSSGGGSGQATFSTDFTTNSPTDFSLNANFFVEPADPAGISQDQVIFTLSKGSTVIATRTVDQDSFLTPSPISLTGVLLPGSTYNLSVETIGDFAETSGPANIDVTMRAVPAPSAVWTCLTAMPVIIGIGTILKRRRIALAAG